MDTNHYIDLRDVWKQLRSHKRLFLKVWGVTFVAACAWILPVPRTYKAEVMLAPETENPTSGGALGSLASSFGFNMGAMMSSDALYPMLYPDLMSSNDFIVGLWSIPVRSIDGKINTDYYTYLTEHQKKTFYKVPFKALMKLLKSLLPKPETYGAGEDGKIDPFFLSEEQAKLVKGMESLIVCSIDKKTDVITITVNDQDPYIAACLADSVCQRLQDRITAYRTSKARIDAEHYAELVEESRQAYEEALRKFSEFSDAHRDAQLQAVRTQSERLESDAQMKFTTYNAMNTQLEAAKARVQERTPAFTILQGASVPVKPNSPKRMIFIAAMLLLATFGTSLYILRDEIAKYFQ